MASSRTVCVVSLGSFLALAAGFVIATEVRAGDIDEVPEVGVVDADTLARASAFAGEYTFAGGQKERDDLDAAIETTLAAISPVVRGIGRKRLHESNPIPKSLSIAIDGDSVEIRFDGAGHSTSLDGKPQRGVSPQGDKIKVSHRMRGSKLTELLDGDQGDRHNTFKIGSDGKLTVDVKITSGHLPVPLEYQLTFKRK